MNEKFYIDTYGKTGSVTHVEIYPAGVIWFCQIPGITEDWNLHQNSDYYISAVQAFQDHVKESSLTLTDGTIIPIYSGEASSVMHSDTYVATCLFKENDLVKMLDNSTTYVSINSNSYSVTNEN